MNDTEKLLLLEEHEKHPVPLEINGKYYTSVFDAARELNADPKRILDMVEMYERAFWIEKAK